MAALSLVARSSASYTPSIDQESHCSEVSGAAVGEALIGLRRWLKDNDVGGLSISQTAAHVLIQIKKSENHLSRYMKKMLAEPNALFVGFQGGSQRDLGFRRVQRDLLGVGQRRRA